MSQPAVPLLLLLATTLALAGCGSTDRDGQPAPPPPPPVVRVLPLLDLIEPLALSAPASVVAPNESQLSAEVAAPVLRVHADVGATVARGALLLELDATDLRLVLGQAQARAQAARARVGQVEQRLARARTLVERDFVSADEIEALETEVQSLHADVAVAQADQRVAARNVEKARVLAPFVGVVTERQAQVGTLASVGMPLLRLVDLATAEVEAALQDDQAGRLDQAVELAFHSQGRRYPLQLLRLAPVVNQAARTRVARLGFIAESAPAGSTGTLHWQLPARQLPARLLVRRGDALGVFVAEDGQARFVPVPGASEGRPFEIDLPARTRVVAEGQQGLNDGDALDEETGPAPADIFNEAAEPPSDGTINEAPDPSPADTINEAKKPAPAAAAAAADDEPTTVA